MVIKMILDEFLLKWIKNKKNLYGLVGFTIIMIILAADFAFWAGEISINAAVGTGPKDETDVEEEPWMYQLDVDDSHSGTLMLPSVGNVRIEGVTYAIHEFEVRENATLGFINVTVSGQPLLRHSSHLAAVSNSRFKEKNAKLQCKIQKFEGDMIRNRAPPQLSILLFAF